MSLVLGFVLSSFRRATAGTLVLALVAGLFALVAALTPTSAQASPKSPRGLGADSIAQAMALAAKSGEPATVESLTTENTLVTATPEGGSRREWHADLGIHVGGRSERVR